MPTAGIFTIILAGLIIAAAALGLMRVIFHLRAVVKTLNALIGGVDAIVASTDSVPDVVPSVNANLQPVREFCESI